jgi:hypothetical protein
VDCKKFKTLGAVTKYYPRAKERTKFALASRPCKMYSQVNSNPLAPTQRGANLCSTESANAQPATREVTPTSES